MECNWYDAPCVASYVLGWFEDWFLWAQQLLEEFKKWLGDLPKKVWADLLDASASAIESIPVPDFVNNAANAFGNVPASVLYFTDMFALGTCISIVISAYLLRFFIRRLPIIG